MQAILPRIVLVLLSAAAACFFYVESVYYADHAAMLGARSQDVAMWMWIFRIGAFAAFITSLFFVIDLIRKVF